MVKKAVFFTFFVLSVMGLMAQAPGKFTYQAVVRNSNNVLVANSLVGARVSVVQGSPTGTVVYLETHAANTNANGLLTLTIGDGSVLHGSLEHINWANGPYYLETEIDPNGGNTYTLVTTQQMLSVPYALYAASAGNTFSGSFNDLTDVPELPAIPVALSAFVNDVGYITMYSLPQNVSYFNNDAGYITMADVQPLINALYDAIDSLEGVIHHLHDTVPVQSCPGMTAPLTDFDGNEYSTVQIGSQCWMKDNLRTAHYADGTAIAQGSTTSATMSYRYRPDNNSLNVAEYGYLYNWKAVMRTSASSNSVPSGVQGICPTGWHVPSNAEFTQLTDYVMSQGNNICGADSVNIAKSLAYTSGWLSNIYSCSVGENQETNNSTGFSARPAGYYIGSYNGFSSSTFFWSCTEYEEEGEAWYMSLYYGMPIVGRDGNNKVTAFSVRCLKN